MDSSDRGREIDRLREDAQAIFASGRDAADPCQRVIEALRGSLSGARQLGEEVRTASEVSVVSFGKAACRMARGFESLARAEEGSVSAPWRGLAVVNRENMVEVEGFEVLPSAHPFPDDSGVRASERVMEFIESARPDGLVLVLISGGGSAILPSPAAGISLEDKLATTGLLLGCGASIQEVNAVRKHLSSLKGGGLARLCGSRRVCSLILSDVIGNDLSTIASGPTVGDPTTFGDVRRILEERQIWRTVPESVRDRIERGARGEIAETPKPGDPLFASVRNVLIGTNEQSLRAAVSEAERRGYRVELIGDPLVGEASEAGQLFALRLRELARSSRDDRPVAVLAGGETTVTIRGDGRGGRNQELALAMAIHSAACDRDDPTMSSGLTSRQEPQWVFLSEGTDGIDGPTDAAGAIVDAGTLERGRERGLSAEEHLARNDSYPYLEASGDLVITGASGTNVADLQILLVGAR